MKYCNKCNKVFDDSKNFCPVCGSTLDLPQRTDIFGEFMESSINTTKENNNSSTQDNKDYCLYLDNDKVRYTNNFAKIFTLTSLVASLVPIYGTIIIIYALYNNVKLFKIQGIRKRYVVLSALALIIHVVFIALLVILKVITIPEFN